MVGQLRTSSQRIYNQVRQYTFCSNTLTLFSLLEIRTPSLPVNARNISSCIYPWRCIRSKLHCTALRSLRIDRRCPGLLKSVTVPQRSDVLQTTSRKDPCHSRILIFPSLPRREAKRAGLHHGLFALSRTWQHNLWPTRFQA